MESSPADQSFSRTKTPIRTPTRTPSRRAISADPQSSSRRSIHTPLDRTAARDLLNSVRRGTSASGGRRNNAPTPHAAAARRALDQRRTALFTPGKERRRQSLLEQRQTPMHILRDLGRALAPGTKPVASSSSPSTTARPSSIAPIREEDEGDDSLPLDRPRLSLPIYEDDDGPDPLPPRSSGLEDEEYTIQSPELPVRATSELPPSRISHGSMRDSDMFDSSGEGTDALGRPSDFFPGLLEELQARADVAADVTYDRLDADSTRRLTMGRESDVGLAVPPGVDDQTTMLLSEPAPDVASTSPLREMDAGDGDSGDIAFGGFEDEGGEEEEVDEEEEDFADPEHAVDEALQLYGNRGPGESDGVEQAPQPRRRGRPAGATKKRRRISKHGIEYPPLPSSFVKRVAQTALQSSGLSNPRVSSDTATALTQASEWFFEQLGDDLGAYASHAKRKIIEESDVATLMKRQRQITSDATLFSLAQRHLPRELLQELRMSGKQKGSKHLREESYDSSAT